MKGTTNPAIEALVVDRNPDVHSGDLVFKGTRVPVSTLTDLLKRGRTTEDFLEAFPTVERWQIEAFLDLSPEAVEHLAQKLRAHPR